MRWLAGLTLALAVISSGVSTSEAQVFKPRGGSKSKSSAKKPAAKKASAKKPAKKAKRSKVASKGRPSDLTPDSADIPEEDDYVEIIDDEE